MARFRFVGEAPMSFPTLRLELTPGQEVELDHDPGSPWLVPSARASKPAAQARDAATSPDQEVS